MSNIHAVNVYLKKQIHSFYVFLKAKSLLFSFLFVAALVITLFLYEAEPFNISRLQDSYKMLKLSGFGFIYSGLTGLCICCIPQENIYPAELSRTSILKMMVILIVLILIIGIINCLYTFYIYDQYLVSGSSIFRSVKHTFTFSLVPFLLYIVHLKWREKTTASTTKQPKEQLTIWFDKFKFVLANILYIKADENYILVYYLQDNKSEKQYIRYRLKQAEEDLSEFNQFLRVQRSYIVNLEQVKDYSRKLNEMELIINEIDETIKDGRKLQKIVKNFLNGSLK